MSTFKGTVQSGVSQTPTSQNNVGEEMDAALKSVATPVQENVMVKGVSGGKPAGEKNKMSKKQIVGLVVLSLIAIGGVLFGVYGMNSQNEQIAQLTIRATDAEGKVAQLETEKITITDPDGGTTEITDSVTVNDVNTEDYIYVGEWGLKIKIPEKLKYVGYNYTVQDDNAYRILYVSGVSGDSNGIPEFADMTKHAMGLGVVTRYELSANLPEKATAYLGQLVFSDDEYNYYYGAPQAYYSTNENDIELEKESIDLIKEMLSTASNYSKI